MNQRPIYGLALAGAVLAAALGFAVMSGDNPPPETRGAAPPPEVTLDYARAGLPHPEADGYAYQAAVLQRIPQVIDAFTCYCGCKVSLKQCYLKRACPPY